MLFRTDATVAVFTPFKATGASFTVICGLRVVQFRAASVALGVVAAALAVRYCWSAWTAQRSCPYMGCGWFRLGGLGRSVLHSGLWS
jgi:hypothetical protein